MTRKTVIIGRSSHADIVIADGGVDANHGELVITPEGRTYRTDRGSETGTYIQADSGWIAIRQTFIEDTDMLRFGSFQCTGEELRQRAEAVIDAGAAQASGKAGQNSTQLRGAVERDPVTGEIVRRKF